MMGYLTAATLFPVALTGIFTLLSKKTKFSAWHPGLQQAIIGIVFGLFAILSTQYGVPVQSGVVMNVRDAAPLCAGLIFGAPAGLIAGIIGGMYRWLCVYWGGEMGTRLACSLAAFLAGVFSGVMRKRLFDGDVPSFLSGFGIGTTMEVLHMLLVLATNLGDVPHAFHFVQECAFPMIVCNGIAVSLAILVSGRVGKNERISLKDRHISYDFGFWLLVCIVIAFFITSSFTQQIIYRITEEDAELYRHVTLYLMAFTEILIYTALFILIFQMLKKKVVCNLQRVNDGLNAITSGNLNTVIDVRTYKEFSQLSDDVNATVSTLKQYIQEAEQRIDQELEFARQIQHSALPSVFPPFPHRPDFDIYASMHAAKEVGGDFYDFYLLGRFTLVVLVADVSGKGVPAAMFMMRAKTLIKALTESGQPIDEVFTETNRRLCEGNDAGMFITAWMGKLDLRTGELSFINAGHNPPLLRRRGESYQYLRTKPNFVLAGLEMTRYRTQTIQLQPGDSLYLYTDGVTEACDKNEILFGETRLETVLARTADRSAQETCCAVTDAVHAFVRDTPQSDDITMLCLNLHAMQDTNIVRTIPDTASFSVVQEFLDDRLKTAAVPEKLRKRMQITTDEIWSNIVRHSDASEAILRLRREADTLFLDFIDNGQPFDPLSVAQPDVSLDADEREIGGLGLYMVQQMTASMQYSDTEGKNQLTVGFELLPE